MSRTTSANPIRTLAWTFLFLTLASFFVYSFVNREDQPLTEEMQQRDAEQRALHRLDSN